jgi:hypothetical protein
MGMQMRILCFHMGTKKNKARITAGLAKIKIKNGFQLSLLHLGHL